MKIFIPSRGRVSNQVTAAALLQADLDFKIVVSKNDPDRKHYEEVWPDQLLCFDVGSLAEKRQKILSYARNSGDPKVIMMDDDLRFYKRISDGKFVKASSSAVWNMVETIGYRLTDFAHVGLVDKFMSQHQPRLLKIGGRYNQVLAYNLDLFPKGVRFGEQKLNHDHDMNLQLTTRGLPPCILCEYSKDAKYYAKGGLSNFRTARTELQEFEKLQKRWPDYVSLVENKKGTLCGVSARFNWRKALNDGQERRNEL